MSTVTASHGRGSPAVRARHRRLRAGVIPAFIADPLNNPGTMIDLKPSHPGVIEATNREFCLNLWWLHDAETGIVSRIAGRVYSLVGTDAEKTALLQRLAIADYYSVELVSLPERFVVDLNGRRLIGATMGPTINQDHEGVFREVINKLEAELPVQIRWVNGEAKAVHFKIPNNALMVSTCVRELPDGSLVAQISS